MIHYEVEYSRQNPVEWLPGCAGRKFPTQSEAVAKAVALFAASISAWDKEGALLYRTVKVETIEQEERWALELYTGNGSWTRSTEPRTFSVLDEAVKRCIQLTKDGSCMLYRPLLLPRGPGSITRVPV